jgi:hypothetical protein
VHFENAAWDHACNGQYSFFAQDVCYECKMFKNLTTDLTILISKASRFPYSPQGMIKNQLTSVSISFFIDDCTTNNKEAAWAIKPTPGQERQLIFMLKGLIHGAKTFSITKLSITTLSIMTHSITLTK